MKYLYNQIIKYAVLSGDRICKKSGNVKDIGVTKKYLTLEDFRIERGLKKIIKNYDRSHFFCAEEENDHFKNAKNVWVVDPISGTRAFIKGTHHYGISVAHLIDGKIVFAVVYDPSVRELFTAYLGRGAYLNNKLIKISKNKENLRILYYYSSSWNGNISCRKTFNKLSKYKFLYRNANSVAVNYCHVACGRYDGILSLTKDSFPEMAGSLIIREAGGRFINRRRNTNIQFDDRVFMGGNKFAVSKLERIIKNK
ncbi:MAG: hypothetical protein A2406_04225 [Candidatus Komeilibacteria bacterium RIFOXYC1_FULL_37_11]|uniref:Inositol monophosphatase n=1 Tax=Candidatus Komeilibacteria bacterium RIFOXYC1_FULL_37_11 TaxID=1798555 RepID=A0A1G2BX26_9BACT|nr:MAG: hypothetical protein A2406_04225 [Candidatus Komeilibacteria bacterium RIFOXYC1_FULL_37_11]OGY95812.1 MAG: hypothetical protein A2611_03495 [Candidatus Komeilibacteria bacterium RIFOXYD1_FULL_37_29]